MEAMVKVSSKFVR